MKRANFVHALISYSYRIDFPLRTFRPLFFDGNLIDRYFIAIIEKKRNEEKEKKKKTVRALYIAYKTLENRSIMSMDSIIYTEFLRHISSSDTRINIERNYYVFFFIKKPMKTMRIFLLLKNIYTSTGNTIRRPVIRCYSSFFLRFFFFRDISCASFLSLSYVNKIHGIDKSKTR